MANDSQGISLYDLQKCHILVYGTTAYFEPEVTSID